MKNITKKIVFTLAMVLAMGLTVGAKAEAKVKSVSITEPTKKSAYTIERKDKDVKKQLKVRVKVTGKSSKAVKFKTSNRKVVSVSSTGMLTAKKAGKATITVISKADSKKKDTLKITVKQLATGVKASVKKPLGNYNGVYALQKGKKYNIDVKVSPKGVSSKKVSYKSSSKKVATVSSKGQITAKKAGKTTITVKALDGSKKQAKFTVYVTEKIKKKVKSVSAKAEKDTLRIDETTTIKATVSPSKATCKTVAFDSSNDKVATVSATSGKVTAVAPGTATITVKAIDGSKKSTKVTITVKNDITGIKFEKDAYSCFVGKDVTVKALVNDDAYDTTVKYSIDAASQKFATVDETTGVVKGLAKGVVDVTATAADGKKTVVKVTVSDEVVTKVALKDGVTVTATVTFDGDKAKVEKDVLDLLKKAGLKAGSTKAVTVNGKDYTAKYDGAALTFDGKSLADITATSTTVEVTVGSTAKQFINGLQMANFVSGTYEYKVSVGKHEFSKVVLGAPYITVTCDAKDYKVFAENGVLYFVGNVAADLADLADIADITVVK